MVLLNFRKNLNCKSEIGDFILNTNGNSYNSIVYNKDVYKIDKLTSIAF